MKRSLLYACAGIALAVGLAACDSQTTEQKAQGFLASAAEKREAGKLDAAVIELKNALELRPENAAARERLGRVYLQQRRWAAAAKEMRKAREFGADSRAILLDLARALRGKGTHKKILDLIPQKDSKTDLDNRALRDLQGMRAQALLGLDRQVDAIELARRVLESGDSFEARLALSEGLAARRAYPQALVEVERALADRPDSLRARWVKADSLRATGQLERALKILQAARDERWRPVSVDLTLIQTALQLDKRDLAWEVLNALAENHSQDPRVKYFQSLRAMADEDYQKARTLAEDVLGKAPDFVPASYVAGAANLQLDNFEIAREHLSRISGEDKGYPQARALLALAWKGLDNPKRAEELMPGITASETEEKRTQVAAAVPTEQTMDVKGAEDTPADRREAVRAILQALNNGNLDAALQQAQDLEETLAENPLPLQLQAVILSRQNEQDAAVARMKAARELAPDDPDIAVNLAQLYRGRQQYDQALDLLDTAMADSPDNAKLRIEAARIYQARGDAAKVGENLRAALDAQSDSEEARKFLARYYLIRNKPQDALDLVHDAPKEQRQSVALLEIEGRAHRALGNTAAAVEAFRALTAAAPEMGEAHQFLGTALLAADKPSEAVDPLQTALEKTGESSEISRALARAHRLNGDSDTALGVLEEAIAQASETAGLLVEAARAHAARNETAEVKARLREAVEAAPDLIAARTFLARVYLQSGEPDKARRVAAGAPTDARDAPSLLAVKARAERRLGDHDEAAQTLKSLIDAAPDRVESYTLAADILLGADRPKEAISLLEQAPKTVAENDAVRFTRARALIRADQGRQAEALLAELEAKYPERGAVHDLRAEYALDVEADPEAALSALRKAYDVEQTPQRLLTLARFQAGRGQPEAAARKLRDWRQEHDETPTAITVFLAELELQQGRLAAAADLYRELVSSTPDNAAYRNNLAWCLGESGEVEAALEHAKHAVELAPDSPDVRDTYGVVLLKAGKTRQAAQHLRKARDAASDRSDIALHYAEALAADGRTAAANDIITDLAGRELSGELRERLEKLKAEVRG